MPHTPSDTPLVSVVLPVYNSGELLKAAVRSILTQSFKDFELLVLDDGSTDGCTDFLRTTEDSRIRLLRRRHDYIATLNYGMTRSRGKYIARMDADDLMRPTRLAEQVETMEANPEVAICASYMQRLGGEEIFNAGLSGTLSPGDYAPIMLLGNFISHPTTMLRTDFLRSNKLHYKSRYIYAEDFKLWTDIAGAEGKIHIIPRPLLDYRVSEGQVSRTHREAQAEASMAIRSELLIRLIRQYGGPQTRTLRRLYNAYAELNEAGLLDDAFIFHTFYQLLCRIITDETA